MADHVTPKIQRSSGVLLHITSLPSPHGIGDLGPAAYRFADFLAEARQSYWQVLPLHPIDPVYGHSPYSSISAFAGNPLLISPDRLVEEGFLSESEAGFSRGFPEERCDFGAVIPYKEGLFQKAYERFSRNGIGRSEFDVFCSSHQGWLEDFCLFQVFKKRLSREAWNRWPGEVRDREPEALRRMQQEGSEDLEKEKFLQFIFFKQWHALKDYCNRKGVRLFGDLPIYVSLDSADVWTHADLFELDPERQPTVVAGVPPDYFSKTGQRWGNPIYRWEVLKATGFQWWVERAAHQLGLLDLVRIDHFRGLVAYWEVPAAEGTAVNGRWRIAPAEDLLQAFLKRFPCLPVVAEDLGYITPEVKEVLRRYGFPGMKILLFAFGEDHPMHPYLPHTYQKNAVVYTGTHDNNTVRGWFEGETTPQDRKRLVRYLGREVRGAEVHWELIRLAMMSVANLAVVPMQDLLGLGEEARMNRPSVTRGNWEWRLRADGVGPSLTEKLLDLTQTYGRAQGGDL